MYPKDFRKHVNFVLCFLLYTHQNFCIHVLTHTEMSFSSDGKNIKNIEEILCSNIHSISRLFYHVMLALGSKFKEGKWEEENL